MQRLYHVSDKAELTRFEPQPALDNPSAEGNVVWAVDEAHLPNYLLPRDCPRVCFGGSDRRVIALELYWLYRIRSARLFLYEFSDAGFELLDPIAGYYVSRVSVAPDAVRVLDDLLSELKERNVELRILPNLWKLHD